MPRVVFKILPRDVLCAHEKHRRIERGRNDGKSGEEGRGEEGREVERDLVREDDVERGR